MSTELLELKRRIRTLSGSEKLELVRYLIEDLDGVPDADVEHAWLDEAHRRQRELQRGDVRAISGDEVFRRARGPTQSPPNRLTGPGRQTLDEGHIFLSSWACGDHERLAVRFGAEPR